ncbi:MAG: hypothetical protein SFX73_16125 [Kofleriaceae bacterium]|nr:hypothetical protein [Kofleriaceae bacterium]
MRLAAACALALVVRARTSAAEPRVVLVETDVPVPALGAQVELHSGGSVAVTRITNAGGPLAAKARTLLDAHDATLVVWVEAGATVPEAQRVYVVYVAGPWPDRALIELVRVDAATPPNELARIVALKIIGRLDTVLAPQTRRHDAAWRVAIGADVVTGGDRAPAAGPSLSIERRWRPRDLQFSAVVTARTLLASGIEAPRSTVSANDAGLGVAGGLGRGRWFVRAGASATVMWATATSSDGRRGSAVVAIPAVELGVGGRLHLATAEVGLMLGVEHALIRQRFLVDDMVAGDLGRARVMARVSIALPML